MFQGNRLGRDIRPTEGSESSLVQCERSFPRALTLLLLAPLNAVEAMIKLEGSLQAALKSSKSSRETTCLRAIGLDIARLGDAIEQQEERLGRKNGILADHVEALEDEIMRLFEGGEGQGAGAMAVTKSSREVREVQKMLAEAQARERGLRAELENVQAAAAAEAKRLSSSCSIPLAEHARELEGVRKRANELLVARDADIAALKAQVAGISAEADAARNKAKALGKEVELERGKRDELLGEMRGSRSMELKAAKKAERDIAEQREANAAMRAKVKEMEKELVISAAKLQELVLKERAAKAAASEAEALVKRNSVEMRDKRYEELKVRFEELVRKEASGTAVIKSTQKRVMELEAEAEAWRRERAALGNGEGPEESIAEELEVAREDASRLASELEVAREDASRLASELEVAQEDASRLASELEEARAELGEARRNSREAHDRRYEELKVRFEELVTKNEVGTAVVEGTQRKLFEVEEKNERLQRAWDKCEAQLNEEKKQICELQEFLGETAANLNASKTAHAKSEKQVTVLGNRAKEMEFELQKALKRVAEVESQAEKMAKDGEVGREQAEAESEDAHQTLCRALEERIAELEGEKEDVAKKAEEELQRSRVAYQSMEAYIKEQAENFETERESTRALLDELHEKVEKLEADSEDYALCKETCSELEEQVVRLNEATKAAQSDLAMQTELAQSAAMKLRVAQDELKTIEHQAHDEHQSYHAKLTSASNSFRLEVSKAQESAMKQIASLEQCYTEQKSMVSKLQSQSQNDLAAIAKLLRENQDQEERIAELEECIKQMLTDSNRGSSPLNVQKELDDTRQQLAKLHGEYMDLVSMQTGRMASGGTRNLATELSLPEDALDVANARVKTLEGLVEQSQREKLQLEKKLRSTETKLENANMMIESRMHTQNLGPWADKADEILFQIQGTPTSLRMARTNSDPPTQMEKLGTPPARTASHEERMQEMAIAKQSLMEIDTERAVVERDQAIAESRRLEKEVEAAARSKGELEEEAMGLKKQIDALQQAEEASKSRAAQLEEELHAMSRENEAAQKRFQDLKKIYVQFAKREAENRDALLKTEAKAHEMEKQAKIQNEDGAANLEKKVGLEADLKSALVETEILKGRIAELEGLLVDANSRAEFSDMSIEAMGKELDEAKVSVAELTSRLEDKDKVAWMQKASDDANQVACLNKKIQDVKCLYEALAKRDAANRAALSAAEERDAANRAAISAAEERDAANQKALLKAEHHCASAQTDCIALKDELSKALERGREREEVLEEELRKSEARLSLVEAEVASAAQNMRKQSCTAEAGLKAAYDEAERLKTRISELEAGLKRKDEEALNLEKRLKRKDEESLNLEKRLADAEVGMTSAESLRACISDLERHLHTREEEARNLNQELEHERTAWGEERVVMKLRAEGIREGAIKDIEVMRRETEREARRLRDKVSELEVMVKMMSEAEVSRAHTIADLQSVKSKSADELAAVEKDRDDMKVRVIDLEQRLREMEKAMGEEAAVREAACEERDGLAAMVARLEEQVAEVGRRRSEAVDDVERKLEEARITDGQEHERLRKAEEAALAGKADAEREKMELWVEKESLVGDLNAAKASISEMESRHEARIQEAKSKYKARIADLEVITESLRSEIRHMKQQLDEEREKSSDGMDEIARLSNQVMSSSGIEKGGAGIKTRIEDLEREAGDLRSKLKQADDRVEELEREAKDFRSKLKQAEEKAVRVCEKDGQSAAGEESLRSGELFYGVSHDAPQTTWQVTRPHEKREERSGYGWISRGDAGDRLSPQGSEGSGHRIMKLEHENGELARELSSAKRRADLAEIQARNFEEELGAALCEVERLKGEIEAMSVEYRAAGQEAASLRNSMQERESEVHRLTAELDATM